MRHQERKRPPHPGEDQCPGCRRKAEPPPQGRQRHGGGGLFLSDLTDKERAAVVEDADRRYRQRAQPPAAGTRAAFGEAENKIRVALEAILDCGHDPEAAVVDLAEEVKTMVEGLQVDLDAAKAENRSLRAKLAAATLGGTDADRLRDLEAAARDARDWLAEALDNQPNSEAIEQAHARLEEMNLGDGDPDAATSAHAYPDDSASADEGRVAALERAIAEAVGILACHDLHGDETALAARQAFEGLEIPGLAIVTRCASCAEPIEEETETCPDCKMSLLNNLVSGLEAIGREEGDDDA